MGGATVWQNVNARGWATRDPSRHATPRFEHVYFIVVNGRSMAGKWQAPKICNLLPRSITIKSNLISHLLPRRIKRKYTWQVNGR